MQSRLVLVSYHHKNTEKLANVFAEVLDAPIKAPEEVDAEALQEYDLIGWGSGIYGAQHHEAVLDLAGKLPEVRDRKAFIFSTSTNLEPASKNHAELREKLRSKGYVIAGEFTCAGFNTNSFSRFFGGMDRGRPNEQDLQDAEAFAQNLVENARSA